MENNNDIRYFSIGERVTTVSELSKDYRDKEGTIISLKRIEEVFGNMLLI